MALFNQISTFGSFRVKSTNASSMTISDFLHFAVYERPIIQEQNKKNASQDADSFGTNICVCYNSLNNNSNPPLPTPINSPMSYIKRKGNL